MRAIIAFALCTLACAASFARGLTVDDLLGIESYGQVFIAPGPDLILVEHRRGYAAAPDFGYDTYFNFRMASRILATSASRPGKLEPLVPQSTKAGYWIGSLSPGRTKAAIYRLEERRLSLGVVDLTRRTVRWFPSAPDLPSAAPGPAWIDEDRFIYIAMTVPRLPASLSAGTAGTRDLLDRWERQERGEITRTSVTTKIGSMSDGGMRQAMVASATSGDQRVLMQANIVDYSVAPSGRKLAIVSTGLPVAPPARAINAGFDSRRHHVHIVDLETNRTDMADVEVLRGVLSWSSGDRLLIVTRKGGADWRWAHWTVVNSQGGHRHLGGDDVFAAVEETGAGRIAYGGWAGSSPVALVRSRHGGVRWVRLRPHGTTDLPLTSAARPVGAAPAVKWMLDGRTLVALDRDEARIVSSDVDQAGPVIVDPYSVGFRLVRDPPALPLVVGTASGRRQVRSMAGTRLLPPVDISTSGQVVAAEGNVVISSDTDRHATVSLLLARPGSTPRELGRLNTALSSVELPRTIDLKTIGTDGRIRHDWLLLPPSGTRPPLIVTPYPGLAFTTETPREAGISRLAIPDNALILVNAGFAVLLPSMPLVGANNPADTILPRVDEATDAAIATGLVDENRIGLQGHSFGGYAALTVATRSSRYKAIVAANGPYDLLATHGNMPATDKLRLDYGIPAGASIGWTEGGQGGLGPLTDRTTTAYLAASPMLHLDRVNSAILLVTGDLDPVDITQSERAFMELYRHGKDATLARYWGEGHSNASSGNIRDYWRLITAFFDEHLTPGASPASKDSRRARH